MFYSFVKSNLNLIPSLSPLFDVINVPLTSDFDKASFLINHFKLFLGTTTMTSTLNLLKNIAMRSLEYKRLEFDLITHFKLVKQQLVMKFFIKVKKNNTFLEEIIENLHKKTTLTMFNATIIFSIVQRIYGTSYLMK